MSTMNLLYMVLPLMILDPPKETSLDLARSVSPKYRYPPISFSKAS